MPGCCTTTGYRQMFSERRALADARRYRRRCLDRTSRRLVQLVSGRDVEGRTVLEVGGGIGAIEIELLRAGAARAVNVELTPTYEEAAAGLLQAIGLAERVERRLLDFAEAGDEVAPADIVVLNRVICCYPDMPRLAGAAAGHARRTLALSFPNDRWWTRLALGLGNVALRAMRREFRVYAHPPRQVVATVEGHGLRVTRGRRGVFWQVVAFERA